MKRFALMAIAVTAMTLTAGAEYVNAPSGLRVRETPSLDAPVVRVIGFGEEISGTTRSGWLKLEDGYVSCEYLSDENPLSKMQYLGEWRLTAYASTGCPTASGLWPEVNVTVAHNALPFGTKLFIQGYGILTVQDRGPAYLGSEWCDLFLGDTQTCIQFGERTASVYLLTEETL